MRRAMKKPRDPLFNIFAAQITELNKYLQTFPGSSTAKNMDPEELSKILLHSSQTRGQNKPTYRDGILKEGPTLIHTICSSA